MLMIRKIHFKLHACNQIMSNESDNFLHSVSRLSSCSTTRESSMRFSLVCLTKVKACKYYGVLRGQHCSLVAHWHLGFWVVISWLQFTLELKNCAWYSSGTNDSPAHPDSLQKDAITLILMGPRAEIWTWSRQVESSALPSKLQYFVKYFMSVTI